MLLGSFVFYSVKMEFFIINKYLSPVFPNLWTVFIDFTQFQEDFPT